MRTQVARGCASIPSRRAVACRRPPGVAGPTGLPCLDTEWVVAPREGRELGAQGLLGGVWVVMKHVVGELAPRELPYERLGSLAALLQGVLNDLPRRDLPPGKPRRELTCAAQVRSVTLIGVARKGMPRELKEALVRSVLAGAPI